MGKAKPKAVETTVDVIETGLLPKVTEKYIRIRKVTRPGDNYDAYQPEVLEVQQGVIVNQYLIDKPNLFEFAFSTAADFIDPRNSGGEFEAPF